MTGDRYGVRTALQALAAPLTLGAVVVLVLNDHVLKVAWPSFVTGKLSDVAGLVVAPVLLTLALAVLRVPGAPNVALALTAVGFTWVKTTVLGAGAASAAWTWVWGPSLVLRDPTDLLALPALLVAALVLRRTAAQTPGDRRARMSVAAGALVLPLMLVSVAATSPCYGPGDANSTVTVINGQWDDQVAGREARFVLAGNFSGRLSVDRDGTMRPLTQGEEARLLDNGRPVAAACDRSGGRCWRIPLDLSSSSSPDIGPVVEASSDGGRTWTIDYAMTEQQLRSVQESVGETCGETTVVRARYLSVLDSPEGARVAVAVTGADLLLRAPDGTWTQHYGGPVAEAEPEPSVREGRRTFRPVSPHVVPVESSLPSPSPTHSPAPTSPACASPTTVTITPDPRNGPPVGREQCPAST